MRTLDTRLLEAHATGDLIELIILYEEAADSSMDETARGFYLTHAYVLALEAGSPDTARLRQRLVDMGRETPEI